MRLDRELLKQARRLSTADRRKPRQVSLRRAVSASYYALFHLLAREATGKVKVAGGVDLRRQVGRALDHAAMNKVCKEFPKGGKLPERARKRVLGKVPPDLRLVAATFVKLQAERHKADYDTHATFRKPEALALVAEAEAAFEAWDRIRTNPFTEVFLLALLFGDRWDR